MTSGRLLRESVEQREHPLPEVFNGLRYIVKTGASWRWMPNDLPPWAAVYQWTQRWLAAGGFEALAHDLRAVLRLTATRSRLRPCWTAGRCARHVNAERVRPGTGTSAQEDPSCPWPWTRWAICRPCT